MIVNPLVPEPFVVVLARLDTVMQRPENRPPVQTVVSARIGGLYEINGMAAGGCAAPLRLQPKEPTP